MKWQDWVISTGNFALAAALVPSVVSDAKPAILTSAMTAFILYLFGVSFFTLRLKLSALTVTLSATMWLILLIQEVM